MGPSNLRACNVAAGKNHHYYVLPRCDHSRATKIDSQEFLELGELLIATDPGKDAPILQMSDLLHSVNDYLPMSYQISKGFLFTIV